MYDTLGGMLDDSEYFHKRIYHKWNKIEANKKFTRQKIAKEERCKKCAHTLPTTLIIILLIKKK